LLHLPWTLYDLKKETSAFKAGKQYKTVDFEEERNRVATQFRNNGSLLLSTYLCDFDIDTIGKKNKANVNLIINNYSYQDKDL
jgi:hypothetical protein